MYLVFYPVAGKDEQFINHPDDSLNIYNLNFVPDAKKVMRALLASFDYDDLKIYDMLSTSPTSRFPNIEDFVNDMNHQEIDLDNYWSVNLNLHETDMLELTEMASLDYVIIDKNTNKPTTYHGNDDIVFYGDYDEACNDLNKGDKLLALLSYETKVKGEREVFAIRLDFNEFEEIGSFKFMDSMWDTEVQKHLTAFFAPKDEKKMYLVQCTYADGEHFQLEIRNEMFHSKDKALDCLKDNADSVEAEFKQVFGDDECLNVEKFEDTITIDYNHFADWWEGKVIEICTED